MRVNVTSAVEWCRFIAGILCFATLTNELLAQATPLVVQRVDNGVGASVSWSIEPLLRGFEPSHDDDGDTVAKLISCISHTNPMTLPDGSQHPNAGTLTSQAGVRASTSLATNASASYIRQLAYFGSSSGVSESSGCAGADPVVYTTHTDRQMNHGAEYHSDSHIHVNVEPPANSVRQYFSVSVRLLGNSNLVHPQPKLSAGLSIGNGSDSGGIAVAWDRGPNEWVITRYGKLQGIPDEVVVSGGVLNRYYSNLIIDVPVGTSVPRRAVVPIHTLVTSGTILNKSDPDPELDQVLSGRIWIDVQIRPFWSAQ